jgi:hypothetical protein
MIRIATQPKPTTPEWHEVFLRVLPAVRKHARISFRHLAPENREDCIEEAICNVCCAVARLAELSKLELAHAGPLARFAVAQIRDNRRVGCLLNVKDVMSPHCRAKKKVVVERLDHFDESEGCWLEAVVEDRRAGPSETARIRLDFADWLRSLPRRNRRIAEFLALGNRTSDAARKFRVSEGRVSQLRGELRKAWKKFVGEADGNAAA